MVTIRTIKRGRRHHIKTLQEAIKMKKTNEFSKEYEDIENGNKVGHKRHKEELLAIQFISIFFRCYPHLEFQAIEGLFDSCQDDNMNIRKTVMIALPSLCKCGKEHTMKVSDILSRLLQLEDPQEYLIDITALCEVIKIDPMVALKGFFKQVASGEDIIQEKCIQFISEKFLTSGSSFISKEDFIFSEIKKVLQAGDFMLKAGHPKEEIHSQAVAPLDEQKYTRQIRSSQHNHDLQQLGLKRFKRSDNLKLPRNFHVGHAVADGNCFFDSFRQGLEQLRIKVTVQQLREDCKEFARDNPPKWFVTAISNSYDDNGAVRTETPDVYTENILKKYRWGDPEVEGRILCGIYRVKLHVIEKRNVDGREVRTDQIIDSGGSRSVNRVNYNEGNTIRILNGGYAHFEPVLQNHELRSDFSDYNDEIMPEEELINIIKSSELEEEKVRKIEKLFRKEPKLNINFQDDRNDTPLHIAVRKNELKVIALLVKNGAKIDIKNDRGRSPLDIAEHRKQEDVTLMLHRSNPIETLSEEVKNKLEEFVEDFVGIYEMSLSEYYERLETQRAKSGKWADLFGEVIETGKSGTEGIELPEIKATTIVGINFFQRIISGVGTWYNRKELKKLIGQLYVFKKNPEGVRKELVRCGVDVFRSFESQFVQVTADGSWERAMTKLADDAVNRAINYHKEHGDEEFSASTITKGILLGKSKRYKNVSFGFHTKRGHTLKPDKSDSCNAAEIFDKPGLVTIKTDGSANKYYKKKDGNSDTNTYGYRLPFQWEFNRFEEYQEETPPNEQYKYILKPENEKFERILLDKINNQDVGLTEERLRKNFEAGIDQIKRDAEENFNELESYIDKNHRELSGYIKNNGDEIKRIFREVVRRHREDNRERQEIVDSIEEGRKENREGFKQTDENLRKIYAAIAGENSNDPTGPIWFDIRESVRSFTGRKEQLNQIATAIKQGTVLINGLGGVGKSELAIKYARSYYGNDDSVLWINAETFETAKDSFRRLLKVLRLKTRDQDGDEKSVTLMARDVYNVFSGRKSLFIFDNAKEYSVIKEFLPASTDGYRVLITSQNRRLFNEQERGKLERFNLDTLPEDAAVETVKTALKINNTLQDNEIKRLVKTLGCLPLALQYAAAYIRQSGYIETIRKFVEIYKKSEEESRYFLNRDDLSSYDKSIFLIFETTIDKVKREENGRLAEEILNTVAYFASNNIDEKIFLRLANERVEESDVSIKNDRANGMLTRAINLFSKYSIINLKEQRMSIHRLVQDVIRLRLKNRALEEEVLGNALGLLREYTRASPGSAGSCIPHVVSIWDYASKYSKLIESFIVDNANNKATVNTTYFDLIIEGSSYEVIDAVIKKIGYDHLEEVINAENKDGGTPLHRAVLRNDGKIVERIVNEGANVNAKKSNDWTPLHLAAKNGNLQVVNALLGKGANVDDKTKYRFTPLHLSARNGHEQIVEALLGNGANVDDKTGFGFTPLHLASKNNRLEVVRTLLTNDQINVDAKNMYNFTPLHLAAEKGHTNVVRVLLDGNADIDSLDSGNFTPLHLAARNGHFEVVNVLLDNGADIDAKTSKGNTALHLAAEKNHLKIVQALIVKHSDIDTKNNDGNTPSDLAHSEVKDYILSIYKRTRGAAGIEGQLCEINLSMLFLLKGVTDERIGGFHLASNMEKADKFDDIVFKYEYNEGIKIIFLQAKHKTDQKSVNINSLLSESGDFSLKKYFISYRRIKREFSETRGPIFSSTFEDSEFVIYTNAPFVTARAIKQRDMDPNDLRISDSETKYYQLDFDGNTKEKIVNLLKDSSDSRRLAKELVLSISSGKGVDIQKDIFQTYHIALQGRVIEIVKIDEGRLRDNFLNDEGLSAEEKEFRRILFEEAGKVFKKQGNDLKKELEKKIKLSNKFGVNGGRKNLPNDDPIAEDEIKDFLNKFRLYANQPSENELEKLIKDKIKEVYRVEQQDIDSVFSDVEYRVKKWWQSGNNYITNDNKFFEDAARVSIRFDVKEPVSLFTGRTTELQDLHEILQDGGEAVISQTASVTGLGGVGKTELARKYITVHNKDYDDNIVWINSDSYLSIDESFRRFARDKLHISSTDENGREKELKVVVEDVYRFFAKRRRRSLFVFDNAGKYKALGEGEGVDKFLPTGPNKPHVLITSRDQEWGDIQPIKLGTFNQKEAVEFIEKALKDVVTFEGNEVERLAEKLQYFPLALRQAVAYIKVENQSLAKWSDEKFTINNYLELYKKKASELLNNGETYDGYTETVLTTWEVTINKIKRKKVRGGERALEILHVIAYLAPDEIPVDEIFSRLIVDDEVRHSALELLDQYSMANLDGGKLNIHRLVQEVTRIKLKEQNQQENVVAQTFRLLKESFPYNDEIKDYDRKKQLLPHSEALLSNIDDWLEENHEKRTIGEDYVRDISKWMSEGYGGFGNPKRQTELLERVLGIDEKYYGDDHLEVARILGNLGTAYGDLGDHQKQKKLLQRALAIKTEHYGPDHFEVARAVGNLGNAYGQLGDHRKQKELFEQALPVLEKYYGPNHSEVARILINLGAAYGDLGDHRKKKELLERALKIKEEHYGLDHFEVARALGNLGNAYGALGNPRKQNELLERALAIQEKHYGDDHFEVAKTLVNLGNTYEDLGNHQKKKELLERALPILERHYGPDHFVVARTLGNLATAFGDLGDYNQQKRLLEQVLAIKKNYYGYDHFEVARTLVNLSNTYGGLGDARKEKELLEQALPILERHYGPDHYQVGITLGNLATAYADLGNPYKEKELLERALPILEKHYGDDHFEISATLVNLADAYGTLGDHRKQMELLERAFVIDKKHYGTDHFEFGRTLVNLGNAYGDLGDHPKKKELLEQALKILEKHYGPAHFEVARTLVNLGDAYGTLGDHQKQMELLNQALAIEEKHYGSDHFEIATTLVNLCITYGILGYDQKKNELLKRVLPILEKHNHPFVPELRRKLDELGSLHFACKYGRLNAVKTLLEEGSDVLSRNSHNTVLHEAVYGGNEEVMRVILEKIKETDPQKISEHINAKDTEGDTPLMWAAETGKTNAAKILLEYGVDPNVQNRVGKTALHWAANGGYQEIVQLLLDNEADPNIKDKDKKTPLDLADEKLDRNPENDGFKTITNLLRSVTDESFQDERVSGSVSLTECLPEGNRMKREAGDCLFEWEDVDEFNTEKDDKRDFNKIKIDSEKFVDYIKDLSEEKRRQLIELADQVEVTGKSKGLLNNLIDNQKLMGHLNTVGRISGMTMHGMMAKNVLSDFLNGNYQGVAVNIGFIAGGQGFSKVAQTASIKGLKLVSEGKLLLGRSLKAASPFLSRGTSAFVVYDLINQIKERNGTEEALGVVGDGIYLGVDSVEIGIEVAEAFEVFEGVSSVTGPIAAGIGAVVFVGTDIYTAVKTVDKIDQIIRLEGNERFIEGLRAFIGMQPERYVEELMEEKQLYNRLVKQGLEYLQKHDGIRRYVFPTGKSVVDSCRTVPYKTTECNSGGFGGGCVKARTVTRYTEECTTRFQEDLDNTVVLDRGRNDIKWRRTKPDDPKRGYLFCLPRGDYEPVPTYGSYLCENAIGLSTNKPGNLNLINLGDGNDYAKGFMDSPNIFVVRNGSKEYYGGDKDDIFILQASGVTGYLSGGAGVNTLDLTSFAPEEESIDVKLHIGEVKDYYQDNSFGVSGINRFLGRRSKADHVFITCDSSTSDINFVDGQGGSETFVDRINIYDKDCSYDMQIVVRPDTVIYNRALEGSFRYTIPYAVGSATIDFIRTNNALNVNNTFTFEYEPTEITNIDVKHVDTLNKSLHVITFNFSAMSKEFNVTISFPENPSYRLGNNTEIIVGNEGLYVLERTNKSVDQILERYVAVANRLDKTSFFIQSLNESVAIGSGNHEVIHNDPLCKSHLVGNGGENVYVIDSGDEKVPEVVIYDLDVERSVDTIDLRKLVRQANYSRNFQLHVVRSVNDLLLKGTVTEDLSVNKIREYFTVRLKDGVDWYNKTHVIINNVPMRISRDIEWSLKPLPLVFEKDKEVIIVTTQDIEENAELLTPRRAGNYRFVRDNDDLMITNGFDGNVVKNDLCTIVLSRFYEEPKMGTLSIKFSDTEVVLKEHRKEISKAKYLSTIKKERQDEVYKEVFGSKNITPEVSEPPYRLHEHRIRNRRSDYVISSGTKPSSLINNLFDWVKNSIDGLFNSKTVLVAERLKTPTSISRIDARSDVNGTIVLLDVFIRKVTGRKYISSVDQPVSLLEARGYALDITEEFEKVVREAARDSKISTHRLDINFIKVQEEITGKIMCGQFDEISTVLKSRIKKICPGKLSSKKFYKFMDTLNNKLNIIVDQSEAQILSERNTLQVNNINKQKNKKYSCLYNFSAQSFNSN